MERGNDTKRIYLVGMVRTSHGRRVDRRTKREDQTTPQGQDSRTIANIKRDSVTDRRAGRPRIYARLNQYDLVNRRNT